MARTRSVDFLPEIFQTSTNRQVLAATLDQLIQEPQLKQIQGFPADYKIAGSLKQQIIQIGNAVPPGLIKLIAEQLIKQN